MEERLTHSVPSQVISSDFSQPWDVDAVASVMSGVYERDQHENERVEDKEGKEEREEGKRSEGMLVAQEKGNRALGAEDTGGNTLGMKGKRGVCWECRRKGGRWDLRIVRETRSRALLSMHTVRKMDLRRGPGRPQGRVVVFVRRKRLVVVVMREGLV